MAALPACATAVAFAVCVALPVGRASAAPPTRFSVSLEVDLSVTIAAGALGFVPHLMREELVGTRCAPQCDRSAVNGFDALAIGHHSAGAALASDALVGSLMAMPLTIGVIDALLAEDTDGWSRFATDMVITAEAVAISSFLHGLTKFALQRPRPYVFDEAVPMSKRQGADSMLSFFSGHSALGFAAAVGYSVVFMRRHPDSPLVVPVWVGLTGLAAGQAVLRPFTGEHWWSDVLVGSAVGTAVGLLIPWLHTDAVRRTDSAAVWTLTPMTTTGGFGLGATLSGW